MSYQLINVLTCFTIFSALSHPYSKAVNSYFLTLNSNDTIPSWVRQLYTVDTTEDGYPKTKIIFFKKLTDSTSYAIVEYHSGTGVSTSVATQKKRQDFKNMHVGREQDSEPSDPIYSTVTYRHDSLHKTIFVTIDDEIAKSKFTIKKNGVLAFKDGYSMDNVETYHRITKKTLEILRSGDIKILQQNSR